MRNRTLAIVILAAVIGLLPTTAYKAYASDILKDCSAGAGRDDYETQEAHNSAKTSAGAESVINEETDTDTEADDVSLSVEADTSSSDPDGTAADADDPAALPDGLCVADVDNSMNVREEPSENASLAGYLYSNCVGTVIEQKNGWTHLKSGQLEGWAKNDYLLFGDDAIKRIEETVPRIATVKTETLRVRESAAADADVTALLANGQEVDVTDIQDGWTKIKFDDGTEGTGSGYVSSAYVDVSYDYPAGETYEAVQERLKEEEKAKEAAAAAKKAKEEKAAKSSKSSASAVTNNGGTAATADDVTLLAALIQCEAGYEPYEGQLAVGAVVVNRARGSYGSIAGAIYAPAQFGPASSGKLAAVLAAGAIGANARTAAAQAISGTSNIGSCTHFRNVRSGYSGIVIGNHVFW